MTTDWPLTLSAAFVVVGCMFIAWKLSRRGDVVAGEDSCGCVFCDVNLLPIYNAQGDLVHPSKHGDIPCHRTREVTP